MNSNIRLGRASALALVSCVLIAVSGCTKSTGNAAAVAEATPKSEVVTPLGTWTYLASNRVDYKTGGRRSVSWFQATNDRLLPCWLTIDPTPSVTVGKAACGVVKTLPSSTPTTPWIFRGETTFNAGDPTLGNVSLIWLQKGNDIITCRSAVENPVVCSTTPASLDSAGGTGDWKYLGSGTAEIKKPNLVAVAWFQNKETLLACTSNATTASPVCAPKVPTP